MSRIARVDEATDAHVRELYGEIVEYGFGDETPINFFTAIAGRSDLLEASWDLTKAILVGGSLPNTLKQMIALCISRQNDCRYCSVVHQGALEAAGVDPVIVESCVTDPEISDLHEPHRSIVLLAMKAARDPASVTDDDRAEMATMGLSEGEIVELLLMAGFTNFINAWADISGIPLDSADR